MKKIGLLLITILFYSTGIFAGDSYLQVSLYDDGDFRVMLDNSEMSSPGNVAEFDNLSAGEHYLKIMRESANVPPQGNVIFDGKIKIPADYSIYAVIDEYNAFTVYKKVSYSKGRITLDPKYYRKCGSGNSDYNYNNDKDKNRTDQCGGIMNKDDFSSLKKDIGNRSFETSNVSILKEVLDKNIVSSDQVRELMDFFTFETNKLEIAKYAYKSTCDKNNYFKVYSAFSFDSSVDELKNYISGK